MLAISISIFGQQATSVINTDYLQKKEEARALVFENWFMNRNILTGAEQILLSILGDKTHHKYIKPASSPSKPKP